jgi:LPXTG-motif cell wall-anchored protein
VSIAHGKLQTDTRDHVARGGCSNAAGTGQASAESDPVTASAAGLPAGASDPATLAATGIEVTSTALVGLIALVAGSGLLIYQRIRRLRTANRHWHR